MSEELSNCCGAPLYPDMDICTDCKEHCEGVYECPKCEGDAYKMVSPLGLGPPYLECPDCGCLFED